jgi:hypothetical protein
VIPAHESFLYADAPEGWPESWVELWWWGRIAGWYQGALHAS